MRCLLDALSLLDCGLLQPRHQLLGLGMPRILLQRKDGILPCPFRVTQVL